MLVRTVNRITAPVLSSVQANYSPVCYIADKVELKTQSGSTVLHGTVVRIEVMRTIVRTEAGVPVAIPNKVVTEMIVSNESLAHPDHKMPATTAVE